MGSDYLELKAQYFSDCEERGEDHVRLLVGQTGLSGSRRAWAIEWLASKDQESRLRNGASQAESLATAVSAKDAAWEAATAAREAAAEAKTANTIATVALIAAVIAIAVAVIGVFLKA